jgi:predicted DNA-binding transcriptional regulator YafY
VCGTARASQSMRSQTVRYLCDASAVSRPTTRVLAFLELLQDHPGLGGRELAARLEVQPRTIRRYAVKLQELGIPVEAERGRAGGYRLRPGFRLPPLMLDDDEATAVTLGLLAARRLGLAGAGETGAAVDRALAKILRVLPGPLRERALAVHEAVGFVAPGGREPEPAPTELVLALAQAIRRHRRVRVRHVAAGGHETVRDVDPFGVVGHAGRWYVVGHDGLRAALRTFRVDRLTSVHELSGPAGVASEPPPGFDAVAHVVQTLARGAWRHEVEVILHTTPDAAGRWIGPTTGELSEHADGTLLRVRAEKLGGMAQMLAGLGFPFTVIAPDALRDEIAALAERLQASAAREAS